ncbi:MAG: ATP synthase F1 subunit gamma [Bacteroidota bacterium]|nr:ATP synthase F1 subunit gamma [Bacteroidota bacterium]
MPGLKEVRIRIASVRSTQQITNAMKMVAASKLRKAQTAILKLRPYAAKLREILQNLSSSIENSSENTFSKERDPNKILIVVIASNRGLCGGFNSNIIKATQEFIETRYPAQFEKGNVSLICIGRKASEFFSKKNYHVIEVRDDLLDSLRFDIVSLLAEKLMKAFTDKEYDRIHIIYNQFKNAAVQRLIMEQFLPIVPAAQETKTKAIEKEVTADYIFEPDKETILRELIPKTLRIQLFKAILDSFASEQGARMTAMQKATDNADDLLKELQISYNKARQSTITNEILEIVNGAEALKG